MFSIAFSGRGSREPCGLKYQGERIRIRHRSRGSREPCGLKYDSPVPCPLWIVVEARESLVD